MTTSGCVSGTTSSLQASCVAQTGYPQSNNYVVSISLWETNALCGGGVAPATTTLTVPSGTCIAWAAVLSNPAIDYSNVITCDQLTEIHVYGSTDCTGAELVRVRLCDY